MKNNDFKIDFFTMRENCIQIHQEVFELFCVAKHIGEKLNLPVKSADELRTSPLTETWDGMGRFAKQLFDDNQLWDAMPDRLLVKVDTLRKEWVKEKAKKTLLDCYYQLGGKNLYKK